MSKREGERESKTKRERAKGISSHGSSVNPADGALIPASSLHPDGISRVLGALPRLQRGPLHGGFSLSWRQLSCFLCKFVVTYCLLIQTFLEMGQRHQGFLSGPDSALQFTLSSWLLCFPFAVLCYASFHGLEE